MVIFITYNSFGVRFSIISSSMLIFKICTHLVSCWWVATDQKPRITILRPKTLFVFESVCWKCHWKKLFEVLQTLPPSNMFSNILVPTLNINKSIKWITVSTNKILKNQLFLHRLFKKWLYSILNLWTQLKSLGKELSFVWNWILT